MTDTEEKKDILEEPAREIKKSKAKKDLVKDKDFKYKKIIYRLDFSNDTRPMIDLRDLNILISELPYNDNFILDKNTIVFVKAIINSFIDTIESEAPDEDYLKINLEQLDKIYRSIS